MESTRSLTVRENLLWNSSGTFVYLLCQWLTTIVVVRLSGYEDAGILSLAMSITNVFHCISLFGIRNYQASDLTSRYTEGTYRKARYITCSGAFLLCVLFVFLNSYPLAQALPIGVYMVFKLAEALADVYHGALQKIGRMDMVGKSFLIRGAMMLIGFLLGFLVFHNLLAAIILMGVLTTGTVLLYDRRNVSLLIPSKEQSGPSSLKSLLWFAVPLALNLLFSTIVPTMPRYFLERLYGSELLGVYSSIAAPAMIVQVAASFLFTPLITPFAVAYEKKQYRAFYKLLIQCGGGILLIMVAGLVGAQWLGEWGLQLLFGPAILPYSYLLLPLVLCTVLTAAVWFLSMLLTVLRVRLGLLLGSVFGIICCLVTSPLFLQNFYINGASFSLILSLTVEIICFIGFFSYQCCRHFNPKGAGA